MDQMLIVSIVALWVRRATDTRRVKRAGTPAQPVANVAYGARIAVTADCSTIGIRNGALTGPVTPPTRSADPWIADTRVGNARAVT